ncbi:MAG: nucleotidyltransferase domain-containing protein [Spirochaetia bacterium]|nr:nucleotidyltransferase domain-containing protein [Spirochaetia bacterium]
MGDYADFGIDLDRVRSRLQKKEEERTERLRARWLEARRDFEKITARIILTCSPRRIYQWGSLLDFSRFSEISDIDIALEGLSGPEEYFRILGLSMEMTSFPVDLIEIDKIDSETARQIKTYGKMVYEHKDT